MKMRDGKVIDGTAFYDSISFNDLWTRVQPSSGNPGLSDFDSRRLVPPHSTRRDQRARSLRR